MANKKREIANRSYENKFSKVVKLIETWPMTTLKYKKENGKVFHGNDTAQIISEICGNSKRQILDIKRAYSSLSRGKKNGSGQRSLSRLIVSFFEIRHHHNSRHLI